MKRNKAFPQKKRSLDQVIELIDQGIIEIDEDYIKINLTRIHARTHTRTSGIYNKLYPPARGSSGTPQQKSKMKRRAKKPMKNKTDISKFLPLAKYLSDIIRTNKNIKHTQSQIKSWANEIRKLHQINKIDIQRIKRALGWYKMNIGGEYIPVIESGGSFRQKFIRLEDARERSQGKKKAKPIQVYETEDSWMSKKFTD